MSIIENSSVRDDHAGVDDDGGASTRRVDMDVWMGECQHVLESKRLVDVRFPGTHNSFSRFAGSGPARRIAACQSTSVEEQLAMGVRLFDCRLRMCSTLRSPGATGAAAAAHESRVIRTYHGSETVGGNSDDFLPILHAIAAFLRPNTRSHEVVILSMSHLENFTDADRHRLRELVIETFGSLLLPHPGHGQALQSLTMGQLWATPHRVIALIDDRLPPPQQLHGAGGPLCWAGELYPASYDSHWPDKRSLSTLLFENETIAYRGVSRFPNRINVLQCQTTPVPKDVAEMALGNGCRAKAKRANAWYKRLFRRRLDDGLPWLADAERGAWGPNLLDRAQATHLFPLPAEGGGSVGEPLLYACDAETGRWLIRGVTRSPDGIPRFDGVLICSGEWHRLTPVQVCFHDGLATHFYLQSSQPPPGRGIRGFFRDEFPYNVVRIETSPGPPAPTATFGPVEGGSGVWGRVWSVTLVLRHPLWPPGRTVLWCYDPQEGSLMLRTMDCGVVASAEATRERLEPGCHGQVSFVVNHDADCVLVLVLRRNNTWHMYRVTADATLPAPVPVSNGALHPNDPVARHAEILRVAGKTYVLCSRAADRFRALYPLVVLDNGIPTLGPPVCSGKWLSSERAVPWPAGGTGDGSGDGFIAGSGDGGRPGWMVQRVTTAAPRLNGLIADFVDQDWCEAVISPYITSSAAPQEGRPSAVAAAPTGDADVDRIDAEEASDGEDAPAAAAA